MTSAPLFSWLAGTPIYRDAHLAAVDWMPAGSPGDRWMDFGCGPGLITIAAAAHGYDALGIDVDSAMIAAARRRARSVRSSARFALGTIDTPVVASAEVVSAASLLTVVADPAAAMRHLWDAVVSGGTLLVVETTPAMTPQSAREYLQNVDDLQSRTALRMWANARRGRAVNPALAASLPGSSLEQIPLLGELLELWAIRKEPA